MAHYPADTFQEATEIAIEASNQLHRVINGDATTEITVEDDSKIPSVRKAQLDSMYFKSPIAWSVGTYAVDYLQLYKFEETNGTFSWWFTKSATTTNQILMTSTPHSDPNWTLYSTDYTGLRQVYKRLAAEAGFNLVDGSFEEGTILASSSDVAWCKRDGKYYGWLGALPKTVAAGTAPVVGAGSWVDRADVTLRGDLEDMGKTLKQLGWPVGSDISPYLISAASTGVKKVILPRGILYASQINIDQTFSGMAILGAGSGFAYTPATTIRPIATQDYIFSSATGLPGCDNVKLKGIYLDGNSVCKIGVNQLSGAAWRFDDIRTSNFTEWGLYSEQGLNEYSVIYGDGHYNSGASHSLGCFYLYSDYSCYHIEATGGAEPIKIGAGGGRIVNAWANSGTESCLSLIPLNSSTNHINTSITNLYAGETFGGSVQKPIIKIVGTAGNKVRDVQIGTSHIANAQTIPAHINDMIYAEYAQDLTLANIAALGYESYQSATCVTSSFLTAVNSNDIVIGSGIIRGITKNPIKLTSSTVTIGDAVRFVNWGGAQATGDEKYCIRATDSASKVIVNSPTFINLLDSEAPILRSPSGVNWSVGTLNVEIPGSTYAAFDASPPPYRLKLAGDVKTFKFGGEVTYYGTFSSAAGGGLNVIKTFASSAEDHCYQVTIQQAGTGANATSGKFFINGTLSGAITEGNTNAIASLQNTFSASGLDLRVNIGTGYGVTTWVYQITRLC